MRKCNVLLKGAMRDGKTQYLTESGRSKSRNQDLYDGRYDGRYRPV
jgi:hypothetical protein